MTHRPRILILRGGAIGDFILTLPAIRALREAWPDATIELIGYPHIARLGLLDGLINRVDSLDRAGMARLFSMQTETDADLRARIRSFDLVISYLYDPLGIVCEHLEATGVAQVLYASPVDPQGHAADHLARPLESLAIYAAGRPSSIDPGADARAKATDRLREAGCDPRRAVWLHPGSGSPKKNWPIDRFLDLAQRLQARNYQPVLSLGEADEALRETVSRVASHRGWPVVHALDLCDLAAALSVVCGYAGNDSGITHLAAAVGIPVLALFGPSDAGVWGPRGPNVALLRMDDGRLESIDVDHAEQTLLRQL